MTASRSILTVPASDSAAADVTAVFDRTLLDCPECGQDHPAGTFCPECPDHHMSGMWNSGGGQVGPMPTHRRSA